MLSLKYISTGLRRVGGHFHRKKIQDKEQSRKMRESSLFKIKETEPLTMTMKQKSSFLRHCCYTCTPSSRVSFFKSNISDLLCTIFDRFVSTEKKNSMFGPSEYTLVGEIMSTSFKSCYFGNLKNEKIAGVLPSSHFSLKACIFILVSWSIILFGVVRILK